MRQLRRNPFHDIEALFDRYHRAYALAAVPGQAADSATAARPDWLPAVDIVEQAAAFAVSVELPGVSREDVKVSLDKGVLSISGESRRETSEGETRTRHGERAYGSFSRHFTLPENVDAQGIDAAYRDGVLTLTIPKAATPEPRAIEVKVH